jgi:hypothetical protein
MSACSHLYLLSRLVSDSCLVVYKTSCSVLSRANLSSWFSLRFAFLCLHYHQSNLSSWFSLRLFPCVTPLLLPCIKVSSSAHSTVSSSARDLSPCQAWVVLDKSVSVFSLLDIADSHPLHYAAPGSGLGSEVCKCKSRCDSRTQT